MRNRLRSIGLVALVVSALMVTGVQGQISPRTHSARPEGTLAPVLTPPKGHPPSVLSPRPSSAPLAGIMVVVDAGHGGDDAGVDPGNSPLSEKVLTLDLAKRLERQLQAQGARVFMTRTTDHFVSLGARVRFTNALLFRPDNTADQGRSISLHFNSNLRHPNQTGVEVLVDPMAPADPFATQLAQELAQTTGGGFGYRDEGYPPAVHPADVAPVRWTFPRAANVLSEPAFLSNPSQAKQLRDPDWLEELAAAHVRALRRTLQR